MKSFLFLATAFAFLLISCKKDEPTPVTEAKEITLSKSTDLEMQIAEKQEVTVDGGDGKNYEVSSSNKSVIEASLKDKIITLEAKSEGEATITVTSAGKSKEFTVKVIIPEFTLSETSLEMKTGDTKNISITGEKVKDFQISVSVPSIIEVRKSDTKTFSIEAKSEGEATITVTSAGASKELKIKVLPKEILIKNISFDKNQQTLVAGRSIKLTPTIEPSNASNQELLWESSDPNVIRIGKDGTAFGSPRFVGKTAIITATAKDGSGVKTQIEIKVTQLVHSVEITLGDKELMVGTELQLNAIVLPEKASSILQWKSDNTEVVSVDDNGVIKALKEGSANIKATATDGSEASHSIEIKVVTEADELSVTQSNNNAIRVRENTKTQLTFTLLYENEEKGKIDVNNPLRKFVKYYPKNREIAYINDKMELIAIKRGTTSVTISYEDGRTEPLEIKLEVTVE